MYHHIMTDASAILIIIYIIGSITFILGLKMLSHPETARRGNLIAAGGMTISILGTIFLYPGIHNLGWIFGGIIIGSIIGTVAARKVQMTAMPQMVSLFNGMGGACAAIISLVEFQPRFADGRLWHERNYSCRIAYRQRFICRKYDSFWKTQWQHKRFFSSLPLHFQSRFTDYSYWHRCLFINYRHS